MFVNDSQPAPKPTRSLRGDVLLLVLIGAAIGWAWLISAIVAILATTDMTSFGPGMNIFNRFNQFADLPPSIGAALAVICEPLRGVGTVGAAFSTLAMWIAMVLAMMLPSAAPVLAIASNGQPHAGATAFVLAIGYLTAWIGFSVAASALQITLGEARLMRAAMSPMIDVLAATTLVAAGLYQFTSWKIDCLERCRNPAPLFLGDRWRLTQIYRRGIGLGLDCLGCCWALMAVMFAVGVMNLVWIAGLAAIMALEKIARGRWLSRSIGAALILTGLALLLQSPIGARLIERLTG